MKKIQDRVLLGVISGTLAAIPGRILNKIEFEAGLTDSRYEQMAALLFVSKKDVHKQPGKVIGKIANGLLANAVGITTTYTLSTTGRDYAILKGIGVTSLAWLGMYGFGTQAKMRKSKKPLVPLLSYLDHVIFGTTTALLVKTLGDDKLFPDNQIETEQGKLPLVP
jgi:multidrug transporter EmrE-like cation transporter